MLHTYIINAHDVPPAAPGMVRWFVDSDGKLKGKTETGALVDMTGPIGRTPVIESFDLDGLPSAPDVLPGKLRVFGREQAGRIMLGMVGPSGLDTRLQPHLGLNRVSMWQPNGVGTTTFTTLGGAWATPALTAVPMADTEIGRIRKVATAAAYTGYIVVLASDVAYSRNTGYHLVANFGPYAAGPAATRRFFCGFAAANPTNVALSGYAGLGVQADAGQANLSMRGFDGAATDLGGDFPATSDTAWYRMELFCAPMGDAVGWQVTHLLTGATASGEFTGAQLPAADTFLAARTALISTAASAQTMWLGHQMIETDL